MYAFILAAGIGSRLGKYTYTTPKPMLRYKGKPLLQHNIENCVRAGIKDIIINLHHYPEVITDYFGNGSHLGARIQYLRETNLLGTSGGVKNASNIIKGSDFIVVYGDNYFQDDFQDIIPQITSSNSNFLVCSYTSDTTTNGGLVLLNKRGLISNFVEKPIEGVSVGSFINAGLYKLNRSIFRYIPQGFSDFAKDIFPKLIESGEEIGHFSLSNTVKAFDTPELYKSMDKKTSCKAVFLEIGRAHV